MTDDLLFREIKVKKRWTFDCCQSSKTLPKPTTHFTQEDIKDTRMNLWTSVFDECIIGIKKLWRHHGCTIQSAKHPFYSSQVIFESSVNRVT